MGLRATFAVRIAAGAVMIGLVSGCGSTSSGAGGSHTTSTTRTATGDPALTALLPKNLQSGGTVEVASDIPYPPFEFYESDGKTVKGLEPELAKEIGDLLGLNFHFNAVSYDTLIPSMKAGKYGAAFTGMSDTKERQKQLTFIDYLKTGGSFLVNTGAQKKPTALEQLCGLTVGAQSATVVVDFLTANVAPKCPANNKLDLKQFTGQDDLVNALRSKRVDVAVIPSPSAGYLVKTTNNIFESTFTLPYGILGVAVPADQMDLAKAIQAATQKLKDNGTYIKILSAYGLQDLAVDKITINAATE